ncbi:MAG TPA: transposase, partial [Myxococcaceae bacterium]|nr:transposase [Myxococcaceae bacterium]
EVGDEVTDAEVRGVLCSLMPQRRAEELMQTMGQRMKAEGRAEGRAEYVLRILAARGVRVDARSRRRILECTDLATLDRWFDRALSATRLSDLFGAS